MIDFASLLSELPKRLRQELFDAFRSIERNYRESRWEPSELNGGKLCEVAYTICRGYIDGSYPAGASKPANMVQACRELEQTPGTLPRSVRIQIPRMIMALYEIRNNRGVGHVGGEVDPNHMDATCVVHMSKWIVGELVRLFHEVSVPEATQAVAAMSERELTTVWKVNGVSRVLDGSRTMLQKTLLILYGSPAGVLDSDLVKSLEPSNPSAYRKTILRKSHKNRLLEYDEKQHLVTISPSGSKYVEDNSLI